MQRGLSRVVLAGLIAPLTVLIIPAVVLLSAGKINAGQSLRVSWVLALEFLFFAYLLTFAIGIPSYLFLWRRNLASVWAAAATGFLAAWVLPLLIALVSAAHDKHPMAGYWALAFGILKVATFLTLPIAFVGMAVGIVFWVIARTEKVDAG